jgi:hypothetical protein
METKAKILEPLLEKVEAYSRTSFELMRLKALDKTTEVASTLISKILVVVVFLFFAFSLNIAFALWMGDLLGKNYYGFLLAALVDGIFVLILSLIHPLIKARLNDSLLNMFNIL